MLSKIKGKEIILARSSALLAGGFNILSGSLFTSTLRAIGGLLSITGNASGWIAEKLFLPRENKSTEELASEESTIERIKCTIARNQLVICGSQKTAGAAFLVASGICKDNTAETVAGALYVTANTLEIYGEKNRAVWLSSALLSSTGATSMIIAGINRDDKWQTAAGAAYLIAATLLVLANPKKYTSFSERVSASRNVPGEREL